jgi:hypothetical protein
MPSLYRTAFLAFLLPSAAAAQDNPFALTGGSVKSAYIVYQISGKPKPDNPMPVATAAEVGITPDRWLMRMVAPYELSGKKDTMKTIVATSGDSQYTYLEMGGTKSADVSLVLRRHLAKEYAGLDAAGKSRLKENLKLLSKSPTLGEAVDDEYITITGQKKGSESIAGHKCDVYQQGKETFCVLPQAPRVVLRSIDEDGIAMVAKKVTLNGPVPSAASVLPKGVPWKKEGYAYEEFAPGLWEHKKQSDPSKVPPATLAKFAVRYLASPVAAKELKEMDPDMSGAEETGDADDDGEDESE